MIERLSAVYADGLSRDVCGLVGGEPCYRGAVVFGGGEAGRWNHGSGWHMEHELRQ